MSGSPERKLLAWEARSLTGCLYELQRNTDAVCALIVNDDAAILAKVTTNADFDIETLGAFSSMIFAAARMLVQELRTEDQVLGGITIGTEYQILVMGITPRVALVTLCRNSFAKGLLEYQARALLPRMMNCLDHLTSEGV